MAIFDQYTNTDFVKSVRLKGALNNDTNAESINSTDNILLIASEELHSRIVPMLMTLREEFYVTSQTITIVAGTSEYDLTNRAMGFVVRDVRLTKGTNVRSIPLIPREDQSSTTQGDLEGVYLEHDKLKLYPTPATAEGTITVDYYWRPQRLAQTSDCAQIASIASNVVTVSTIPSSWATSDIFDFVSHKNPYINHAISQTSTDITSTAITFASVPTDLVVNDWICPEGKSAIPQLPIDARNLLTTATCATILHAIGDKGNGDRFKKEYEDLEKRYMNAVSPRTVGENKKIVSPTFFNTRWW